MPKPKIAIFSGPRATVTNSPPLVTSNKGRACPASRLLPGRFDHLVGPAPPRARRRCASRSTRRTRWRRTPNACITTTASDYYEVELRPEDGPYLLPYMARRERRLAERRALWHGAQARTGGSTTTRTRRGSSPTSTAPSAGAATAAWATPSTIAQSTTSFGCCPRAATPCKARSPA